MPVQTPDMVVEEPASAEADHQASIDVRELVIAALMARPATSEQQASVEADRLIREWGTADRALDGLLAPDL